MRTGFREQISSLQTIAAQVPKFKAVIPWGRDNLFTIWTEICTRNPIRMPNKSLQTIATQVPKFKTIIPWGSKQIVSASGGSSLKLWDLSGNCLQTFIGHAGGVSSANFSPDGKQIVSASLDNSLKLWDLSGNCLQTTLSVCPIKVCKQLDLSGNCLQTFIGHAN
jgi:WD40 repeat protein